MSTKSTPGADRLRALGIRPAQVRELAAMPLATIEAAIADSQARPAIRDQAAWVVSLLRDVRDHGWDLTLRNRGAAPSNAGPSLAQLQASIERARASGLWTTDADAPPPGSNEPAAPPISGDTAAALQRARASGFFGPREEDPGPAVNAEGDDPTHGTQPAPPAPDPGPGQRAGAPPTRVAAPAGAGRPDWIAPADWQTLPALLRGMVRGSRREGKTILAADPWRQAQLARVPHAVAHLLAASAPGDPRIAQGLCYNGGHDAPDDGRPL